MERNDHGGEREVGGYLIVSRLGSGASGTVYKAVDGEGTPVALKVLHPALAVNPDARARLIREVAALQKFSHPAIARVLDAEVDDAEPFIVTELIDGPSLEDEVMGGGPLEIEDVHDLATQLADALSAVHAAGVIHRDIKPGNIVIAPHGPVLIDFGIAQEIADTRMTSHGFVMGTPGYLSPQMLDGAQPDAASDWWSWAGSLVFAATGRAPFGVRPLDVVLARVRVGKVDLTGLGAITASVLGAALAPDVADRPSPEEVVARLAQAVAAGESYVPPPSAVMGLGAGPGGAEAPGAPIVRTPVLGSGHETEVLAAGDPERLESGDGRTVAYDSASETDTLDELPPTAAWRTHAYADSGRDAYGAERDPFDDDHDGGANARDDHGAPLDRVSADEAPGYVRPEHRKRRLLVLALAALPILGAGLYPVLTAAIVASVLVVMRTVAITFESLHGGREARGVRRADVLRHGLALPWYVVRAMAGLIPSAVVAASTGVLVLGALWWVLQSNHWVPVPVRERADSVAQVVVAGTRNAGWVFVAALCFTAAVVVFVLWFGPASRVTRDGARITLGTLAPGGRGALGVAAVVLVVGAVLVLWLVLEKQVVWWPFAGPPDLS